MMTIIVGRGRSKATQRIEIDDPTVSREHCWLTDNGDGTYTLLNKSTQGTFVDGRQIVRTVVTPDTVIRMGQSTIVKVSDLLPLKIESPVPGPSAPTPSPHPAGAGQSPTAPTVPEYSIKHLRRVWDDFHEKQLAIQKRQRDLNQLRSASPMFTLGSGAIATLAKCMGWGDAIFGLTVIMTIIGTALMVYSFIICYKDRSIEEREEANDKLIQDYVCPNPKCRHFMGQQSYHIVRQNKNCPWCKCKFTEQ